MANEDGLRAALHLIADVLADIAEQYGASNRVDSSADGRNGPKRPAASRRHRRAPRMPPTIDTSLPVSDTNRERARQALLRRGVNVRPKEECP
jgi:hypothetical protein